MKSKNHQKKFRIKTNPVAKNLNKFNKPSTYVDRKKNFKNGVVKHKSDDDERF